MFSVDPARLAARLAENATAFADAVPFPHLVIDDFLESDVAQAAVGEFSLPGLPWKHYHHVNEKKRVASEVAAFGPACQAIVHALHSPPFLVALEKLLGVSGLTGDPDLDGSGLQETSPGGFLNIHADHLAHAKRQTWSRHANLLLYLNPAWDARYGGELELWDATAIRCVRRIAPTLNRCVIFRTTPTSFHGLPDALACPSDRARRSIAIYYYRDDGVRRRLAPTRYVPRPSDGTAQRLLIRIDGAMVAAYTALKRYTPLADRAVARFLRYF